MSSTTTTSNITEQRLLEIMSEDTSLTWSGDNALQGLNILSKFSGGGDTLCGSGYEAVYSITIDTAIENCIDEETVITLRNLNWMIEDEYQFACFV